MVQQVWLIPAVVLAAFLLTLFLGPRLREGASYFGIAGVGLAFVLSLVTLGEVLGGASAHVTFPWLTIGTTTVRMGFRVGPLEAATLVMVSLVSWMVVTYSRGYMHGDDRYNRFFSNITLFVFAMLGLVISDNFLEFVFFWELMGLESYLLISHWFRDLENARAGMKAFLVTRLGDAAMFLGIWLYFQQTHTFQFGASLAGIPTATLTLIGLLLFAGAVGKSAQVPLHIWLPDAMAGPTPVSALIHAATMVAAGVFLVARAFPIFVAAPAAWVTVSVIGGVTALVGALIATVQEDIKKTLAYSTISQLGYMMLSLGVGGYVAGLFHLLTHGFFKALLFLGSGSVIHATGTQDMHEMGGLWAKMKTTAVTFMIGAAALAGIPPFAGFFSKDEILLQAFGSAYPVLFWMALLAAFLTAYYMTRAVVLTFFGRPRVREIFAHAHESPAVMTVPLIVLAVPATLAGWLGAPQLGAWFSHFVRPPVELGEVPPSGLVSLMAVTAALLGIVVGLVVYATGAVDRRQAIRDLKPVYVALKQKLYFDHLAAGVAGVALALSSLVGAFDRWVIDGLVNGAGWLAMTVGNGVRKAAAGSGQAYAMILLAGALVGLLVLRVMGG
ncbi:MAG: NADH-quinone oxidoreductase subunit L [Firmicutes bacterium]|nr:NADH-quinone oxidoreductase subunit L [Bacillota bacterium]